MGIVVRGCSLGEIRFLFCLLIFSIFITQEKADATVHDLVLSTATKRQDCDQSDYFLFVCGSFEEKTIIHNLILEIQKSRFGKESWKALQDSGHYLMIVHDPNSLYIAGKTIAQLTSHLTNGIGSSAVIYFHTGIPESGSHKVGGTLEEWTPFTKLQNFFHELSHARHYMNGTWNPVRSEEQAISDENIYRRECDPQNENLRDDNWEKGEQIWFPPRAH
jgi:hypothetical protein